MDYRSTRRSRLRRQKKVFDASKMLTYNKLLRYVFFGLIGLIVAVPVMFLWFSKDLPTPGKLVTSKYKDATRIYDRNAELLYSVYQDENRTYVKLDQVPKNLQNATISIEDKDFYKNNGFSPVAYIRVARDAILGHGLTGGSTITQQLVKNVLLSSERSLPRKIKELILAIQVNQKYSKPEILEMYLNNIPYGGTAIGVEAASQQYFGKKSKDMDLAESAFLAGLPQSPTRYAPFTGGKLYIARTEAVLRQMVANNYISQSSANDALNEIKNYKFSQRNEAIKAPHFVMYVREILAKQFGEQAVASGGLQVTTSLDYKIQEKAEKIVLDEVDNLKTYKVGNGAAMVTDPKTGEILAMVGSKDYFAKSLPEGCVSGSNCVFDPNLNVAISKSRQPGSSLKPVMYAAAFEKGYTAASLIMDTKTDFPSGDPLKPVYSPVNYDGKYHGPVQLRFALGNSLNLPAVKMLAKVGINTVLQKGYDMGIDSWEPTAKTRSQVGLSLVLGGKETSLMDEMTAYGVLANKGVRQDPVSILKVTDPKGHVLYEKKKTDGKKVLSEEVAFIISHILLDNNARTMEFGPNSYLVVPGKTVSVKTGTTDEKRDNWTYGYTPSYVVGVWVGNNDNTPMNQAIASGITGASPIWHKIMVEVLKGKPDEQPVKPDNVIAMQIDSLSGGLPHGSIPQRSEYFVKGTEPTAESPIYKSKDGQDYYVFQEDNPLTSDGQFSWQKGIDEWIEQNHKDDKMYHPPDELKNPKHEDPTPTSAVNGAATSPTPAP
ncbi:MAG TPA: transglycosylase domain-containing protein [Candidatus Saccharimonadales bacterium]|nr:transglycosylase domain-containing protein [Candidatus Saccharimonadales bacterium]